MCVVLVMQPANMQVAADAARKHCDLQNRRSGQCAENDALDCCAVLGSSFDSDSPRQLFKHLLLPSLFLQNHCVYQSGLQGRLSSSFHHRAGRSRTLGAAGRNFGTSANLTSLAGCSSPLILAFILRIKSMSYAISTCSGAPSHRCAASWELIAISAEASAAYPQLLLTVVFRLPEQLVLRLYGLLEARILLQAQDIPCLLCSECIRRRVRTATAARLQCTARIPETLTPATFCCGRIKRQSKLSLRCNPRASPEA